MQKQSLEGEEEVIGVLLMYVMEVVALEMEEQDQYQRGVMAWLFQPVGFLYLFLDVSSETGLFLRFTDYWINKRALIRIFWSAIFLYRKELPIGTYV